MKIRLLYILLLIAASVQAAPMYRVTAIAGPSAIVVERDGVRSGVQLTGIEITDPRNAAAFLTWTVNGSWVMIEDGQVYRSPDGLHVNAELVRKGFARSTAAIAPQPRTNVVYLGELDLGKRPAARAETRAPARRARAAPRSPVRRSAPRPRTARALPR